VANRHKAQLITSLGLNYRYIGIVALPSTSRYTHLGPNFDKNGHQVQVNAPRLKRRFSASAVMAFGPGTSHYLSMDMIQGSNSQQAIKSSGKEVGAILSCV
jgi:hypothetical protein